MNVLFAFALGGSFGVLFMALLSSGKMEEEYRSGVSDTKRRVISKLMDHKTQVNGECHSHVIEIIKMVEEL